MITRFLKHQAEAGSKNWVTSHFLERKTSRRRAAKAPQIWDGELPENERSRQKI
jgi:hypothetical protein